MSIIAKLLQSIFSSDLYIGIAAVVTAIVCYKVKQCRKSVDNEIYDWEATSDDPYNVDKIGKGIDEFIKQCPVFLITRLHLTDEFIPVKDAPAF